jgi:hypothetical protein
VQSRINLHICRLHFQGTRKMELRGRSEMLVNFYWKKRRHICEYVLYNHRLKNIDSQNIITAMWIIPCA